MYMYTRSSVLIIVAIVLCSAGAFGQSVFGRQWALTELNGRAIANTTAYFELERNSRMTGSTGCNRMFGSATVNGGRIAFSKIGTTRMFCGGGRARTETEFTRALEVARRFTISGDMLELHSGNRRLAKFRSPSKASDIDPSGIGLADRKWMLETMNGREASDAGKKAFVVFDTAKGSAGGDTSCNAYGGTLKVNGNRISITGIISTMRACVEDERMGIERSFLDLLKDADNYQIEGDRLTLIAGSRALMTFRGVAK